MTKDRLATDPRIGIWAGLLATAAGEIAASVSRRGRSPASGLARGMVDVSPAMLVDGGVALVGQADKPGLVVIATSANAAAAAVGAAVASRSAVLGVATSTFPHALGGLLALRHGDASTSGTAAATAAGVFVASAAIAPVKPAPRFALATVAAAGVAAVVADRRSRRGAADQLRTRAKLPKPARPLSPLTSGEVTRPRGVAPLLFEPDQFPVIDITVPEPRVDLDAWQLQVDGEVAAPFALTLPELLALPLEERDMLMICVHNPVGGDRMGCARWTGIRIADLLDRAGAPADQGWLVVEAVDGYSNVLPLAEARERAFLAVGMAGQPLPREHGSPARLLVPGRTGQDGQTKWIRRLTVTSTAPLSYWGKRGWLDGTYPVHPSARIDVPSDHDRVDAGEEVAHGYAWASPAGVDAVQVQVDDGPWLDADLGVDLGPEAWRPWSLPWHAVPGRHRLRVRCRAVSGDWQDETAAAPYPHGVRGVHTVTVHVGGSFVRPVAYRFAEEARTRLSWGLRSVAAWRNNPSQ
ncbi:DMSO/TMAO reductase YedYZ, molybdopterin-dependent catalytic subunit [Nocardioides terrae]|uniref:DMSO/TMAO reductase YedYZ, molybdopterin-dependent catalytic subunit n=1 Tax=Nocardioides terrae TaxID=574651 RepID=A0A1I1N7Z5_9ACTN|nr:molybdopterin-dependent oxidoreductase [Nocardioides terrae]SFC93342.1 DMSO/TMAO reductase YedYZ, molybdopterin-dependent catalytic subunit [Nocardioides terrae]